MKPVMRRARLIPVSGIGSASEAERRAASAFLAVLGVVRDLSAALLGPLGAPGAKRAAVEAFAEVQFTSREKTDRPDGLIRVSFGNKTWTAIVEVKTKSDALTSEQVNRYWNIARREKFDHMVTISNEIAPGPGVHPTIGLRVTKASPVKVSHLSWSEILLIAVRIREHTPVEDREQAWLLNELIRYLEHPASGVLSFDDMGPSWVTIREGAQANTLSRRTAGIADVVDRWGQLIRFAALRLASEVGEDVSIRLDDQKEQVAALCSDGVLNASLHIPKTAGDLKIQADVRAKKIEAAVTVRAPQNLGPVGRVSWLVKQVGGAAPNLSIENYPKNSSIPTIASLGAVLDDRGELLGPDRRVPYRFKLVSRTQMGAGRKAGARRKSFIGSVLDTVDKFYETVIQEIDEWRPPVPKRKVTPKQEGSREN